MLTTHSAAVGQHQGTTWCANPQTLWNCWFKKFKSEVLYWQPAMHPTHPHKIRRELGCRKGERSSRKKDLMGGNVSCWGWRKVEELRRYILFPVRQKCRGDYRVSKRVSSLSAGCGVNVSSFIHMAGSKRRKKALLLTLLEVYLEQGLLGWFWQK